MSMFIVLDEAVEQMLFHLAGSGEMDGARRLSELSAALYAEESLITVSILGVDAPYLPIRPGQALLCFGAVRVAEQDPSRPDDASIPVDSSLLLLGVTEDEGRFLRAFFFSPGSVTGEVCEVDVVRLETDIFSRLKGLFDTRVLESKTVSVIGVGSGGSVVAVELAKTGVGNLILIDFDRLKTHNVARHVCGLADVGRFKTRAVRDVILQHNPAASVRCYEADITEDDELLEQV
ncbi:MAG: ThiF family adenylyltransferase, partial [Chloroflexi bacterium]|nr:ThiF family adenylyltransferase [Chloroflexota bacterium]